MTPTAPKSAVTGGTKTSDPRIVSPEIKVIYPSESAQKDLQISEVESTPPTPQVLPTAPPPEIVPTKESTLVTQQTTTPQTTIPAKVSTWKDTLKEHAGLFIAVALISIGIGFIIGKKL